MTWILLSIGKVYMWFGFLFLSTVDIDGGPCSFKRCVVMTSPTPKEAVLTRKGGSQQV